MPIPDYQTLMLPLLRLAADKQEHVFSETVEQLATEFLLTSDERRELLPSGRQPRFDNRVGWATTHLVKARLLERTARGRFRITQRGINVLAMQPEKITNELLMQFSEFREFMRGAPVRGSDTAAGHARSETPHELLEANYQELRRSLADELLMRLKQCSPRFFERVVIDLIVAMGYGGSVEDAGKAVGRSGDDGIDGIIKEDRLGLDVIYLQAKRWEGVVGRPVVQAFAGSLEGHRARKGILITTSRFSAEAREYVSRIEKKIVLIDGEQLANLMIDYNVGVSEVTRYVVKKIDLDYFEQD
ncbi:MAG: restriction endonuclease [Alicyclobacillus sp.]|nr:restriction endonuclease [Alicyclobacillus sp.]